VGWPWARQAGTPVATHETSSKPALRRTEAATPARSPAAQIVTICAAGLRAGVAASVLRSAGFEDVSWVASGVPAWRALGHETVRGDQPYRTKAVAAR
jgi:rhodanese-related sulfurtransferase